MPETKSSLLNSILKELDSFVVAFSGGVDSTFLLHRAHKVRKSGILAITVRTPYIPSREINEAVEFTEAFGIKHKILDIDFPELIRTNPIERCYLCKKSLFHEILTFAKENNYKYVIDGTNADDAGEFRPGMKALTELNIRSPLLESGLTKKDIRELSRSEGLEIWDKPAMTCLLTRIPYDTEVKDGMLIMIEKAEHILFERGYPGTRVRMHGDMARIECLPGYIEKIVHNPDREHIITNLKKIGFRFVSLDLEGYRTGSSNPEKERIMNIKDVEKLLKEVKNGQTGIEEALDVLRNFPYTDLGFAKIDNHREIRTGYPEIIYCAGKSVEQVKEIFRVMSERENNVIGTRANQEMYEAVKNISADAVYYSMARIISVQKKKPEAPQSLIAVITAGTSDMPVAEEAAITAELLGNNVLRIYDAGVAGIHRLVDKLPEIRNCRVIIVIAGMEGALASVVGGLVDKPVIAVPTSIGYGANFGGISALLAMLTSCSTGVTVVNIDNGFGAGFSASMINRMK